MSIIFPDVELSGVKGVLIDIDNTLYEYKSVHNKTMRSCYKAFVQEIKTEFSFGDFMQAYVNKREHIVERLQNQGSCRSRLFAFQSILEEFGILGAYDKAFLFDEMYWDIFMQNMVLDTKAKTFLLACHERKIPVCAVSDMQAHIQVRKLRELGASKYIDYMVTSEEVGKEKPASCMFTTALEKLNLTAQDVIMIGDSMEKDIQGAQALGIQAFHVATE